MPDEKVIEQINSATRGKPSRRWVLWLMVAGLVLVVLAAIVFGAEAWRMHAVNRAYSELDSVGAEVCAHFGENVDWAEWYRKRMTGSDGSAELRAWAEKWQETDLAIPGRNTELQFAVEERIQEAPEFAYPEPDKAEVRAAIDASAALVAEARSLLKYDNLLGVPDLSQGFPRFEVLAWFGTTGAIETRVQFQTLLNDRQGALADLELLFELAARMKSPSSLIDYMVAIGVESMALRGAERLLTTGPIPQALLEKANLCRAALVGNILAM
jgi:hypothetical protein